MTRKPRATKRSAVWNATLLAGAVCALLIGAGFATGQEALQYFAAFGWWGLAGVLVTTAIFLWLITTFVRWGRANPERVHDAFPYFCGKYIGFVLKHAVTLFLFATVVTMVSGAGALLHEAYGLPVWVGSVVIGAMIAVTLLLGLRRLVEIIGALGPAIIVFLLVIAVIVVCTNLDGLADVPLAVDELQPPRAVDAWLLASVLYGSSVMLICLPFLTGLGASAVAQKAGAGGSMLGTVAFCGVLLVMTLALLAAMPIAFDKETPLVALGAVIHPAIGVVFAIVTFLGIYSTAAPLIWSVADHVAPPSSRAYQVVAVGLVILALIGGATLPFGTLVGLLYPFAGYFGLLLMACVASRQVSAALTRRQQRKALG